MDGGWKGQDRTQNRTCPLGIMAVESRRDAGVVADPAPRFYMVSHPLGLEGWVGPERRKDVRAAVAQAQ